MKVTIHIIQTSNGFIAKKNDDAPWGNASWESYRERLKKADTYVIGRKTYDLIEDDNGWDDVKAPLKLVLSKSKDSLPGVEVVRGVEEAMELLRKKGADDVVIGGGAKTNASFLRHGEVDELLIDVEPMLFGDGVPLLDEDTFGEDRQLKLDLLDTKEIGDDAVQLHYRVRK